MFTAEEVKRKLNQLLEIKSEKIDERWTREVDQHSFDTAYQFY